ncbi:hypothetical protein DIPPA_20702 [Diplonema papillatum]|nr:hypothetical protein DIPPA_20702 [Diplonema papillatum]
MKFCHKLREQQEVFASDAVQFVLDYKRLKKSISILKQSIGADPQGGLSEDDVRAWFDEFLGEVKKFDDYFNETFDSCRETVLSMEKLIANKRAVKKMQLKDVYLELQELKFFQELNKTAVRKILKKFDKNIPSHDFSKWRDEDGSQLASFTTEPVIELSQRLVAVYAAFCTGDRAKIAEMELDYHVSCVSDIFSFMMGHSGLVKTAAL